MKLRHNIFVSSTFQDMHFERDMLHSIVIPELTDYFAKKHLSIDLIDLRWGIDTSEDSSEQENTVKILKVCFDEIERSKPFFIGFIGERYGWIPSSNDIESAILGYHFDNEGREMSITEMEMLYALQKFDNSENCLFFIRNGLCEGDIDNEQLRAIYFPTDPALKERCNKLKAYLREKYKSTTFDYNCYWDKETSSVKGLEGLCELVTKKLIELIERELGASLFDSELSALDEERALQESVLSDIYQNTYGRKREINDLSDFAKSSEQSELLVSAVSGLGKSSLIAGFCKAYESNARIIPFFAGISARTTDFHFLAYYLYSALTGSTDDSILNIPYGELKRLLLGELFDASSKEQVIIVIDALDQFAPCSELYALDFVNEQLLPKNVKIIYSALPDFASVLKKRGAELYELSSLSTDDIKAVASGIASKLHKELSSRVLELLATKTNSLGQVACKSPIYLVLLLELLCSFDSDDFASISASQASESLSPAVAIQRYLERTIQDAGADTRDVLNAISAKSILQLGKKYDIITSLLTSNKDGMSEKDIIGITALTDTPVTVADFSLYRRMLRIHLIQRENECWVFNHAIIRMALTEYASTLDNTSLFTACASYYISLPEETENKYIGIIRFLGYLGRYDELVPYALSGKGDSELVRLLVLDKGLLSVLDNASAFKLTDAVLSQLSFGATSYGFGELCSLYTALVNTLIKLDYKENTEVLSKLYLYLGKTLIENGDSRGRALLEICTGILKKAKNYTLCAKTALEICQILRSRDDKGSAQAYAMLAYKCVKNGERNELYARICYTLALTIRDNPLSIYKPLAHKYIGSALMVAMELGLNDLYVECAMEYQKTSRLFKSSSLTALANEAISSSDKSSLSDATAVKGLLYLARQGDDPKLYKEAYEMAIFALARDSSLSFMLLYQEVLESYFYRMLRENDKATCDELLKRLDGINKKLYLVLGDISFIDKRLLSLSDYEARFGTSNSKINDESTAIIQRELKERTSDFKRKKDVYTSLAIKLGIVGFFAYLIIQVLLALPYFEKVKASEVLIMIASNTLVAFVNILMVVVMFYALMLICSPSKRTYNYALDHRSFIALSIATLCLLVPSLIVSSYAEAFSLSLKTLARIFYINASIELLCVVYACSITYFLAYLFNLIINNPFKKTNASYIRHKHRGRELILKHIKMLSITIIPIVAFVPCLFIDSMSEATRMLDLTGLKATDFALVCYIPFVIQLVLSGAELIILQKMYGKPDLKTKASRSTRKHLITRLAVLACSVIVITGTIFASRGLAINESARQNNCFVEKDFIYEAYEGEFITYAYITGYIGNEKDITIPAELGGHRVLVVYDYAFSKCDIERVSIENGVQHINDYAFKNCSSLKQVTLASSVSKIGYGAFENCTQLTSITSSRAENIDISSVAFENSGITTSPEALENGFYQIGNTIAYVNKDFAGKVVIPEGVTVLENSLFAYSTKITEVQLPSTLTEIGRVCFYGCEALEKINLNENIIIGERAFENTKVSVP